MTTHHDIRCTSLAGRNVAGSRVAGGLDVVGMPRGRMGPGGGTESL